MFTPAEQAIWAAVQAVEALPADVRLTDAVILLQAARDSVADYVDGIHTRRSVAASVATPAESKDEDPLHTGDDARLGLRDFDSCRTRRNHRRGR